MTVELFNMLLIAKGITGADLADKSGLPAHEIYASLEGEQKPHYLLHNRIVEALGVSNSQLKQMIEEQQACK